MGIGTSVFLLAIGAILAFAIEVESAGGFNINTIGVILMIAGAIGVVLSMMFWSSWGGVGGRRTTVVEDAPVTRRRVVEDEVI
ncbi:MAG TPA: DUF6458 family protein [Acidimicrobiales bacterium]